jgi:hypothetical protein
MVLNPDSEFFKYFGGQVQPGVDAAVPRTSPPSPQQPAPQQQAVPVEPVPAQPVQ